MTDAEARSYVDQGFELGMHLETFCQDWTSYAELEQSYTTFLALFHGKFPSMPAPKTHRAHCVVWSDYDSQPKVELSKGIRFDTNYYYYPSQFVRDRPGLFTGSAIPMRFADREGNLVDVYQATTQMTDESGQGYPRTVDTLLDNAIGERGYYGVFTANMHTDLLPDDEADAMAIVASAQARGVPIVSALQMLRWLDGRNGSSFAAISWSGSVLDFEVSVGHGARNLRAMLPARVGALTLTRVRRPAAGADVPFTIDIVKGVPYAFFAAADGVHQATYR
jgi:hypothetical protein